MRWPWSTPTPGPAPRPPLSSLPDGTVCPLLRMPCIQQKCVFWETFTVVTTVPGKEPVQSLEHGCSLKRQHKLSLELLGAVRRLKP